MGRSFLQEMGIAPTDVGATPRAHVLLKTEASPAAADVLGQLERILSSEDFDASPRSRAFIRFIVEETLEGRQEALTQSVIATRVFARRDDFDPTVDPIVRIQAGRLRRSLERYYLLAGASDPVRLELPRGSYVPVARWAALEEPLPGAASEERSAIAAWPSVVVSPLKCSPSDAELEEAAARFLDLLCLEIGNYHDVRVVLQRERDELARQPCEGGDFTFSGQLTRDAGGLRVTARLLDCRDASQVWARDYRAQPGASGDFVGDTARVVAASVASEQGAVAHCVWERHRESPSALATPYGAVLRSYQYFLRRNPEDFLPAVVALQYVVAQEPECALAWAQLSRLYLANYNFEIVPLATPIEQALSHAQEAVRLDPASPRSRVALAGALLHMGELAASLAEARTALDLHPDSFVYQEWVGYLMTLAGDWERGPALLRRALERNAQHIPGALFGLWLDQLRRGEYAAAHQSALLWPDAGVFWRSLMRACCLGHLGRIAEACGEVEELLRRKPDFATRGRTLIARFVKFPEIAERIEAGLSRAGLTLD